MDKSIFREKSIEKMNKPDELTDYIKVSSPKIWILLLSILAILVGAGIWAYFKYVIYL